MHMVYGEFAFVGSIFLFIFALIGARNPRKYIWNAEFLVQNIYPIAIIAIGFCGLFIMVTSLPALFRGDIEVKMILGSLAIWALTIAIIIKLKVSKRLQIYDAISKNDKVIDLNSVGKPVGKGGKPRSPRKNAA
jgi:hypothetical protein